MAAIVRRIFNPYTLINIYMCKYMARQIKGKRSAKKIINMYTHMRAIMAMGWLRLVGSTKI